MDYNNKFTDGVGRGSNILPKAGISLYRDRKHNPPLDFSSRPDSALSSSTVMSISERLKAVTSELADNILGAKERRVRTWTEDMMKNSQGIKRDISTANFHPKTPTYRHRQTKKRIKKTSQRENKDSNYNGKGK